MPSKPGRHSKAADGDPGEWRTGCGWLLGRNAGPELLKGPNFQKKLEIYICM